jgi:hypothetical protein
LPNFDRRLIQRRRKPLDCFASDQKPKERCVWMTTKSAFLALGAPLPPAWVHGRPLVEELALPKSVESGNLSVNKAVIRRMSVSLNFSPWQVDQRSFINTSPPWQGVRMQSRKLRR